MTYEEAYMKCKTIEELREMVAHDITTAYLINTDRLKPIKVACEKVANLKFGEGISNVFLF